MHSNSGVADTAPASNGRLRYVKAEQRTKWPDPFASRTVVQFGSGLSAFGPSHFTLGTGECRGQCQNTFIS